MLASILKSRMIPLVIGLQSRTADQTKKVSVRSNFRNAMSQAVTGVNIVTTDGPKGRYGLTVSAVSSVSAEPPMLLVCVNQKSVVSSAIEANGSFAVNVLATGQQSAAETFSGIDTHGKAYTFNDEDWTTAVTKSPVLKGAIATFDCKIEAIMPAATHTIFVGRVQATRARTGTPLLYTRRSYGRPLHQADQNSGARFPTGTKTYLSNFVPDLRLKACLFTDSWRK